MNIWDEIKESFKKGSIVTRILYVNIGVFIFIRLADVVFKLTGMEASSWSHPLYLLSVPSDPAELIRKPWTLITYMFTHFEFLHILFNMLWFYWFARFFLMLYNEKQLLGLYITGGLAGAALYLVAYNLIPFFANQDPNILLGASASVLAIVVAVAVTAPNNEINLMFIGPVKMKYLALFTVVIDLISVTGDNAGGHIAHLGGAAWGWLYVIAFQKGTDMGKFVNRIIDGIISVFKPKPKRMKVKWNRPVTNPDQAYRDQRAAKEHEIDAILEKIKKSGYDSLSKDEKQKLFQAGNH
ncbi:rhomboid family intramembrane serine protease [Saccharicrinis sp. FJH54]|uniref:rhomboid family intramembrane serine protease n=1 Tax=Saccharicrinis sp. FJH54 TaxID=3344665 RepID=UPI0035D446E2